MIDARNVLGEPLAVCSMRPRTRGRARHRRDTRRGDAERAVVVWVHGDATRDRDDVAPDHDHAVQVHGVAVVASRPQGPDRVAVILDRVAVIPDRAAVKPDRVTVKPDRVTVKPDRLADLKPLKPFLIDLAPGATRGMRSEQDGWIDARTEILANQAQNGKKAGITDTDFQRFVTLDGQYNQLLLQLPPVQKAVEVVKESLRYIDHQRHKLVTAFANSAEEHARMEGGDPTLTTAYEATIGYRAIIADKGVKTKEKNEEAKKNGGGSVAEPPGATGPAAPPLAGSNSGAQAVSRIPSPPPDIIFTIDLNPYKSFLVDLPPGATRGMRSEQDGWETVRQEIVAKQAQYGARAGITDEDFNRFVGLNEQYAQLQAQLPVLEKAEEIIEESLAYIDDQRHKLVTHFANKAEEYASMQGGDPTLTTAYQKTIAYRGINADKAVKTRQKNEEAKKAAAPTGGAATTSGGAGPTTGSSGPATG